MRRQLHSRRRLAIALGGIAAVTASSLVASAPAATAGPSDSAAAKNRVDVWTGVITQAQLGLLRQAGLDHEDLATSKAVGKGKTAKVRVEAALSSTTADALAAQGVRLTLKRMKDGRTVAQVAADKNRHGHEVWRPYSGNGGIAAEVRQLAADHPANAKLVNIGTTGLGKPIIAVKVTKDAKKLRDGARPATVYISAQHAREWITPEMTTRLMRHVLENAATPSVRTLLASAELWFVPVVNPDGYDYTFTGDNRLWRKNLRDNDGDGVVTGADGVDPNRNYPDHWGYDNEGSSPEPSSMTYRGTAPASEPETQAIDGLLARVKPKFLINYHSAAELLLYGAGFQVATPTPDDLIYEAMVGDDDHPAVPGYDPDISAELYTTNGDTNDHAHNNRGVLGFTPEMSTCETISAKYADDEWLPEDCGSGFEFPDDEALVHEEVIKNFPFALAVARSAADPANPVSVVGRTVPDFDVDSFEVSYGDPQTVAVTARRSLTGLVAKYRVAGGPVQSTPVSEWAGGERYGDEYDLYFAEYRGQVSGAKPGQSVEVWFEAAKKGVAVASEHFTYTLAKDSGAKVLVLANEAYTGANPHYEDLGAPQAPIRLGQHTQPLTDAGYSHDVWDTEAQGVPHPLGVLAHYKGVLWFTGVTRIHQDEEDVETETPFGPFPDVSVRESQQHLTVAVRDYLNEGGKLVHDGELAQYYGLFPFVGGLYYGANGDETAECTITTVQGLFDQCLILADDFSQYWLGAYRRVSLGGVEASSGRGPLSGTVPVRPVFGEAGAFELTSDVLPVSQFPQFESWSAGEYTTSSGASPFGPVEGTKYAGALHADSAWQRMSRTYTVPAGASSAQLQMQMSWNTESHYDHVLLEARTPGGTDWRTLPTIGAGTETTLPAECNVGFYRDDHPFLATYLNVAPSGCSPTAAGWNAFSGNSGGWKPVAFDLSAYAGKAVEISVSYVTDPGTAGVGVFVDDTKLVVDGATTQADGFEGATAGWAVAPAPPQSSTGGLAWQIGVGSLVDLSSAVATKRSVLLGFGLDLVRGPFGNRNDPAVLAQRTTLLKQALTSLGVTP